MTPREQVPMYQISKAYMSSQRIKKEEYGLANLHHVLCLYGTPDGENKWDSDYCA